MKKRWLLAVGAVLGLVAVGSMAGCSQADAVKAANAIHAYLPAVTGLASDAAATLEALDPAEAATVQAVNSRVQADLQEIETVSAAYAAGPSADGWTRLGAAMDSLVGDADEGLMAALAIEDPASQAKAKVVMSALDAAVHVLDGCMTEARTPAQAQASAARRAVKLQTVAKYWSEQDWRRVERAFGRRGEDLMDADAKLGF